MSCRVFRSHSLSYYICDPTGLLTGSKVQNMSVEPRGRELVGSFRVLVRVLLMAHTYPAGRKNGKDTSIYMCGVDARCMSLSVCV